VTADRRAKFVEWARRALAKPAFDDEERSHRLAVAGAVQALIEAARLRRPLRDEALALGKLVVDEHFRLVGPAHVKQLVEWAENDERGLARALRDLPEHDNLINRLVRFAAAMERGPLAGRVAGGGLLLVSLLNFGLLPEAVPLAHPARYGQLRELLGQGPVGVGSPAETYVECLNFAHEVDRLLRDAGVPVRDMVDVDSLISICVFERELWAGSGDASGSRRTTEPANYLAVGTLIRNPGRYLAEWLEFHRLVGVERFFIYDNESDDDETREILASYADEGLVVVHDWPGVANRSSLALLELQREVYMDLFRTHRDDARWIAVIDTDEFLFSPTGRPLPELLVEFERWPAVGVGWVIFGTSGHVTPPPGLVIESYTQRLVNDGERLSDQRTKCILDPAAVIRCENPHVFEYVRGTVVDENGYPILADTTKSRSIERLRINHYYARSEAEVRAKNQRRSTYLEVDPASPDRRDLHSDFERALRWLSAPGARDETILMYAPAVREALARRAQRRAGAAPGAVETP
jgi:hypothetical protein